MAPTNFFRRARLLLCGLVSATLLGLSLVVAVSPRHETSIAAEASADIKTLDPASWGEDHVGQELPEYMESGECLFCHRNEVGTTWGTNKHNRTIREPEADNLALAALRADPATKQLADEVQLIMGDTRETRFLKRSAAYGKLDLLTTGAGLSRTGRAKLDHVDKPTWNADIFAAECAGCHATAVDPETHAFAAPSLDCFTCHGDAPAKHANDPKLMPLAKARKDSPAVVTSICAQCHVRFGKSKSTGLPYPNNFVAGDNLFRDFQVDFALADDAKINPADRHVLDNVRDVVLYGRESMTCLSCHQVHTGSTKAHRDVPDQKYCLHCHEAGKSKKEHIPYEVHSQRCQY